MFTVLTILVVLGVLGGISGAANLTLSGRSDSLPEQRSDRVE